MSLSFAKICEKFTIFSCDLRFSTAGKHLEFYWIKHLYISAWSNQGSVTCLLYILNQ